MNDLEKIINSLGITYYNTSIRETIKPVKLHGVIEQRDILMRLDKGNMFIGKDYEAVKEGDYLFLPAGQTVHVQHGAGDRVDLFGLQGFKNQAEREQYIVPVSLAQPLTKKREVFTIIGVNVFIYNVVPLFHILQMPCVKIPRTAYFDGLIERILEEQTGSLAGKSKMQNNLAEELIISLLRHFYLDKELKEYFARIEYLLDKRLINIVQYVRNNLDKDLSNKVISNIAYVSEDYVGQLFKTLTSRNLQEYIENERLEKAYQLLTARSENIQEIAHMVGFKDPAYFSRRFKLRYKENANAVRRKEKNYMM